MPGSPDTAEGDTPEQKRKSGQDEAAADWQSPDVVVAPFPGGNGLQSPSESNSDSPRVRGPEASADQQPATALDVAQSPSEPNPDSPRVSRLETSADQQPVALLDGTWLDFLDLQTAPLCPENPERDQGRSCAPVEECQNSPVVAGPSRPNKRSLDGSLSAQPLTAPPLEFNFPWDASCNALEAEHNPESHGQTHSRVSSSPSPKRARHAGSRHASPPRYHSSSLSEDSAESLMMRTSNRHTVTEGLLKIYCDVLENNLACWLTDQTCPYTTSMPQTVNLGLAATPAAPVLNGFGPAQFYHRVVWLDSVAEENEILSFTASESRAASRALELSIIALSSQWSSCRNVQGYRLWKQSGGAANPEAELHDMDGADFERCLQSAVWDQAREALQRVSEVESCRVVYAEILFSLAQKPATTASSTSSARSGFPNRTLHRQGSAWPRVFGILCQGGAPVFLERAARKIDVIKFKFDAAREEQLRAKPKSWARRDSKRAAPTATVGPEERATIGFLYWLAVMCDTVSSSTHERPLALAAEEEASGCPEAEPQKSLDGAGKVVEQRSLRWQLEFFKPDRPSHLHWPAPNLATLESISRSVPIKVLLFRKVAQLQNALCRRRHAQIDGIIQSAIATYRWWNVTHGALFRKLAQVYSGLPSRIKASFICVAIPWHLGVMMMADLIDFADERGLGQEAARQARFESRLTARMVRSSSLELADLARLTCPIDGERGNPIQLPGYHPAVSTSAILTEPWTVLLVRAFARASSHHLDVMDDFRCNEWEALGHDARELRESGRRAEECIRALWFLGQRSSMAQDIANLLLARLTRDS
ncbi:hypothetical protein FALCPG4_005555 [Fusarium falciforme]